MHIDYYMGSKSELFKEARIQVRDAIFDLDEIYKHAHDWLDWRKYDITEKAYKEKNSPGGREVKIEWECTRDIDEYSQFELKVKWVLLGVNDVKVEHMGKDVKMQKGEINIYISAFVVLDYLEKWEKTPMMKFMKGFYEKYLYVGTIESLKAEMWKEGWELYNELKAFLNLYRY